MSCLACADSDREGRIAAQTLSQGNRDATLALGAGYVWAWVRSVERPVSAELVTFYRREQMLRLKKFFFGPGVPSTNALQRPPGQV